jgi:nickel-dependent lactate racemase
MQFLVNLLRLIRYTRLRPFEQGTCLQELSEDDKRLYHQDETMFIIRYDFARQSHQWTSQIAVFVFWRVTRRCAAEFGTAMLQILGTSRPRDRDEMRKDITRDENEQIEFTGDKMRPPKRKNLLPYARRC